MNPATGGWEVSAWIAADWWATTGPTEVPVRLSWHESDPYAVRMLFSGGGRPEVTWFVSRDLLARGLHTPSGLGDIHVAPSESCPECGEEHLAIELASPSGWAAFEFITEEVADFLEATYDQVPPGAESLVMDVDAEIEWLLGNPW